MVDDGSTDRTPGILKALAAKYPLRVLTHTPNKGFADTMLDGLRDLAGRSADDDLIIALDCDDTHDPEFMPSAIEKSKDGYDVVLMSRFQKGGGESGLSFFKIFLSHNANYLMRIFFPIRSVKEYSCSYRVYRASALKKTLEVFKDDFIRLKKWGFVATVEILVKFKLIGARMGEVPFFLKYERKQSISKNRAVRSIMGYMLLILMYAFRRLPKASLLHHEK